MVVCRMFGDLHFPACHGRSGNRDDAIGAWWGTQLLAARRRWQVRRCQHDLLKEGAPVTERRPPTAGTEHHHPEPTASDTTVAAGWGSVPWSTAAQATLHCLTGCAIGEVAGMVIGTAAELHNAATVVLSVALAFVFGYALTMRGVMRAGVGLSLVVAFLLTLPVNRMMISRGEGHAVVHAYH